MREDFEIFKVRFHLEKELHWENESFWHLHIFVHFHLILQRDCEHLLQIWLFEKSHFKIKHKSVLSSTRDRMQIKNK
jgi:hypothetical protein